MKKNFSTNDVEAWLRQYPIGDVPPLSKVYLAQNTLRGRFFIQNKAHTDRLPVIPTPTAKKYRTSHTFENYLNDIPYYEQAPGADDAFFENRRLYQRVKEEERLLRLRTEKWNRFVRDLKAGIYESKRLLYSMQSLENHLEKVDLQITKMEMDTNYFRELLETKEDSYDNYAEVLKQIAIYKRTKQYASSAYLLSKKGRDTYAGEPLLEQMDIAMPNSSFDLQD